MKIPYLALCMVFACSQAWSHDDCSSPNIFVDSGYRNVISNGLDCTHGIFPNAHNPNTITAQNYHFRVPINPQLSGQVIPLERYDFGVALNGIPFDPGTAEYWNHDPSSGWNYDAMSGHINLGLDMNHAHVQPNGAYHYHGAPMDLITNANPQNMTLIGYAADGFPIYYKYGQANPAEASSPIAAMNSSYRLKTGTRPNPPGGVYDGTFTNDFEYVSGLGNLDVCNGTSGVTPEYPQGIYHYFVTDMYPFVPRCFKGIPDQSFMKQPPSGGPPGGHMPGPGAHPPV